MAWYTGIFSCGCEGSVDIVGKSKDRAYKIERAFDNLCPECFEKQKQEKYEKALESSEKYAKLEGTEKQIKWAETIRMEQIEYARKTGSGRSKFLIKHLATITSAKQFIDTRNKKSYLDSIYHEDIVKLVRKEKEQNAAAETKNKIDKSYIMREAHKRAKKMTEGTYKERLSAAMKQVWAEQK